MNFTIDSVIFLTFLVVNLGVGLFYSAGMKNAREYAVGGRDFSTSTITATVIATCIGGGFFSGAVAESYRQGLYFIIPALGEPLALVIIGYFFIPRMAEFMKNVSVAEAMGDLYGPKVRIVTAISSILLCIGIVALQFKVASTVMKIFFDVSSLHAVILSATVVILYSSFGGIKAVTFTDIIQFFTFGTVIPILGFMIWKTLDDPMEAFTTIAQNPLFDFKEVVDFSNPKFISTLFLLLFFGLPGIQPVFFQRIAMSRSTSQARKVYINAGLITISMLLIICWTSTLILVTNPNLDPNNIMPYIIETYSYTGLKGLTAIGIMSIIMSTADSYINSAAVALNNDLVKVITPSFVKEKNELTFLRMVAFSIGIFGLFLAFYAGSILDMLLMALSFYMPVVDVPLILAIMGFRTSPTVILIGMAAGISTVLLWPYLGMAGVEDVIPAMMANLFCIVVFHCLLGFPRTPVPIEYTEAIAAIKQERKYKWAKRIDYIRNFNFCALCKKNMPKSESTYTLFGLFSIISIFSSMYSLSPEIRAHHSYADILDFIYHTVLISSSMFLTYPIWPQTLRSEKFISMFWLCGLFYILVVASCLQVIISDFSQLQSMIFLLNLVVISILARWHTSLLLIGIGVFSSVQFFKWFTGIEDLSYGGADTLQFKIMYLLLAVSSILIAFLKPTQEEQELSEEKNEHLASRLDLLHKELHHALSLKSEFIRNVTHEYHAPMTGLISMAQTLSESYGKLSDAQRQKASSTIYESAIKLSHFDNNIANLARLSHANVGLKIEAVNISKLVGERVDTCTKLYTKSLETQDIITKIASDVMVSCDKYYITQVLDNLITNALEYCKKGKITISLQHNAAEVTLSIADEGIGIPLEEIYDIFEAFTVSSKTRTPAGGRGVGLAIAKKVVDIHNGKIWVESNGKRGSVFHVVLQKQST